MTVVAVRADDKFAALDRFLVETGFFDVVDKQRAETGKPQAESSSMIKPTFMFMYAKHDHTTDTDPALVEYLLHRPLDRGYSNLCLVGAQSAYGNFLYNRDVVIVAQHIGIA
jgi:hypothetical protein